MKAAVYDHPGAPDVFRIVDVADPVPGENDVLIAVEAISIEGGDLINRRRDKVVIHAAPHKADPVRRRHVPRGPLPNMTLKR